MMNCRTRNVDLETKMAYAAHVAYQFKTIIGNEDNGNIEIMKEISKIALEHYFKQVWKRETIHLSNGGIDIAEKEYLDIDAFYKDAYEDAVKLVEKYF